MVTIKMAFELSVTREFETEFSKLDKTIQKRVVEKLSELVEEPEHFGKPLRSNLKGLWSARVGMHRIIYTIEANPVFVVTVKHRKKAY